MDVVFLGYSDLNFETKDKKLIDGIKFFYYFPSPSRNYTGYEVGSFFIPRQATDLINQVKSMPILGQCMIDVGFNGRSAIFNGITPQ